MSSTPTLERPQVPTIEKAPQTAPFNGGGKTESTRRYWVLLVVALALVLGGSLLAWAFDTVGWTVTVKDVRTIGRDGALLSGRLYIPPGVTGKNPAPAVFFMMGNDADPDKYSSYSIELSRRGYVVFNYALRGQAWSDAQVLGGPGQPPDPYSFGGPEGLSYLRSLDIVDPQNIAMAAHSMGGNAISFAADAYPEGYRSMVFIGSTPGTKVKDTKWPRNIAIISGVDDSPALSLASVLPLFGMSDVGQMQAGKLYGSIENGTGRVLWFAPAVHNMESVSPTAVADAVDWIQRTVKAPNQIDASNQIWYWRYVGTSISFVGAIFLMLVVGALLLETPFFKPLAERVPQFMGARGRNWWLGAILTAVIPVAGVFYFTNVLADRLGLWGLWPIRRATGILGWMVIVGVITVILLLINHFVLKTDRGATAVNYGLTWEGKGIDWGKIGKSLLLAICVLAPIYLLLSVIYPWLLVDFRMWNEVLKLLTPDRFFRVVRYAVPFALFYIVFAANLHGFLRPKDGSASLMRETLVNIAIVAPWYYLWWFVIGPPPSYLAATNIRLFDPGVLGPFFWAFTPIMAMVAVISTYFFRKTGRVYVGAFISAILLAWMLLTMLSAGTAPGM